MGWMCGHRFRYELVALTFLAASAVSAFPASAEVTTEKSASILIFPKLLFNSTFDSIIQLSNTSNSIVYTHCFYVDARLTDSTSPPGPTNPPIWQEVDFDLTLTEQQPTHWVIDVGRDTNPGGPTCSPNINFQNCNNAGIPPGRIPPVSPGFQGELKCIEVDQSGAPISGNHLKGEVTLVTLTTQPPANLPPLPANSLEFPGDVSKYNAVGIIGLDNNDSNTVLCLGGGVTGDCPAGAEYEGCPNEVLLSNFAEGVSSPLLNEFAPPGPPPQSLVSTELTVVPCAEDFETQTPARVRVQFLIYNEFEEVFSTSTTVTCWGNFDLEDVNPILTVGALGTRFAETQLTPATGDPGFVAVQEEFQTYNPPMPLTTRRVAFNTHVVGERPETDLIVIPEGP